ncbi:type VI secretion system tube protein Hcp [bacterium]|nr:type VI secretion system tube protein Hcp [bacterium]
MAEVAFAYVQDQGGSPIEGECNMKGQEGAIEVRAFQHDVSKQVDPLDCSKVRSDRHHGSVTITTDLDKSFPLLMKALCEGATLNEIKVKWYRQPPEGGNEPEHYFTHTFTKCIVTSVRPIMRSATDGGRTGHMFAFEFGYRQITWTSEVGGTEFLDEVRT